MVYVRDIMTYMNKLAPLEIAEEWDNCGLITGDADQPVGKLLIALEASLEVIQYAVEKGFDMIVTHHPIMLSPILKVNNTTLEGIKLHKLIKNNISLYAAHTNLDGAVGGLNDYLGQLLDIKDMKRLKLRFQEPLTEPLVDKSPGFGAIGELKSPMTLGGLACVV